MGSDHTLYAVEPGYVRFYKAHPDPTQMITEREQQMGSVTRAIAGLAISPLRQETALPVLEPTRGHPSSTKRREGRRYVGVSLDADGQLPEPLGSPRQRRFDLTDLRAPSPTSDELRTLLLDGGDEWTGTVEGHSAAEHVAEDVAEGSAETTGRGAM